MIVPKQIIYPLRYTGIAFGETSADHDESAFIKTMQSLMGTDAGLVPLGRARMGIYLLVKHALAAGPRRKKVILSAYTIPDVINMVVLAGAIPVFVDFEPRSTHTDANHLEQLLGDDVACVLITHYHVNQHRSAEIRLACERHGVLLFEDCAIALGGTIEGRHVGTQSDGAILSLSGFKFLNYFWGGAVFSRHQNLMHSLRAETAGWPRLKFRDYYPQMLRILKYDVATRGPVFAHAVFPILKRRQKRSTETVGLAQPRIETEVIDASLTSRPSSSALREWTSKAGTLAPHLQHRRSIAAIYDQFFAHSMASANTDAAIKAGSCFVNYPVYVGADRRNAIFKSMIEGNLEVGASLYPNCGEHPKFLDVAGKTENTRDLSRSVITLPTHPRVTAEYAHAIAHKLNTLT